MSCNKENEGEDFVERAYKREDMIEDLRKIFSENSVLSIETKSAVLKDFCWAFTERKEPKEGKPVPKAKIKGCTYWSKAAFELAYKFKDGYRIGKTSKVYVFDKDTYKEINEQYLLFNKEFKEGSMVTHEHLIPKKILKDAFENHPNEALRDLGKFLEYFKACVITKTEDGAIKLKSSMPPPYETFQDICKKDTEDCMWSRYQNSDKLAPMIVYKIKWGIKKGWVPLGIEDVIEITADKIRHKSYDLVDDETKAILKQ